MNKKSKAIKILSLEAKDIYNSNISKNNKDLNFIGYNIKNQNGDYLLKKFKNSFDYSLDLIKIREIYEKVFRNRNFSFIKDNREYCTQIICVKFSYAQKLYNNISTNVYIRSGYQQKDLVFKDNVCIQDNILIGIVTEEPVIKSVENKYLDKYFTFEDGVYKAIDKNIPIEMDKRSLRNYLYENGFYCNGEKYIRFKRSSGSSRVGKCLFINEKLYNRMHKWDLCGLNIKNGDNIDLAGFEAYISLPTSSIIDTMELRAENFLLIDDYDSKFTDEVIGVEYENGELMAKNTNKIISNSIFDGQSLIDISAIPQQYQSKGMLLLRNRFFKSACFNTNIQDWFINNGITEISQLNGKTIATKIEDIKIITTHSSIKYLKFGTFENWLKNLDCLFGIVKHEKPPHYFNGEMVQCHYQLLNTLQLNQAQIKNLIDPMIKYICKIREDPDVLKYHIEYPVDEKDDKIIPLKSKNEIIFKLLGTNSDFCKTKMYYNFRDDLIKSLLKNIKQGHIWINGNYATLLGNGIEMLQQAIGTFKGVSILGIGNIYCKRFDFNKTLLGVRSPHICSGNIYLAKNVKNNLIQRYFNLTNEIVYVNAINENLQQRLNGCDYDSDTILLTDNKILIDNAAKNYDKFKVPTCLINSEKTSRRYTDADKTDLDVKTSVNKIGDIVNTSQYLNSVFWNNINRGETIEENLSLYYDICKLAVLSGIEIDKAKKEYSINTGRELKLLQKKHYRKENGSNNIVKPMFFKMITTHNGYELSNKYIYKYFNTPMDYLHRFLNSFRFKKSNGISPLKFSEIVAPISMHGVRKDYKEKCDMILDMVSETKNKINLMYANYDKKNKEEKTEIRNQVNEIRQDCVEYIDSMTISKITMYLLLKAIDDKKYKNISGLIFTTLFGTPNKTFFSMIIQNKGEINKLIECQDGNINLFEKKFAKIPV